ELLSFFGILDRFFQCPLGRSKRTRCDVQSASVHVLHNLVEASLLFAHQLLHWHFAILQNDRSCWLAVPAKLLFLRTKQQSVGAVLYHNARDPFRAGTASAAHHTVDVTFTAATDERFGAIHYNQI